jgi:hypothetical protein
MARSAWGKATRWTVDELRLDYRQGQKISSSRLTNELCGQPSLLSSVYLGLFAPVVSRPEREADNSLLVNTEVMNKWSCTSADTDLLLNYT